MLKACESCKNKDIGGYVCAECVTCPVAWNWEEGEVAEG